MHFDDKSKISILASLENNYFLIAYQSFYNQIGYENKGKFSATDDFKDFVFANHFVDFIGRIYNTHISTEGIRIINGRLKKVKNLEDYDIAISIFEKCNPTNDNRGNPIRANQFCLGTRLLHFYDPEQNPILDNIVKDNLGIKGENGDLLSKTLCIEFREAAKCFVQTHPDYFYNFYESDDIGSCP